MKVLSLSLDPLILQKESVVASRCVRYGTIVDLYTVIIPTSKSGTVVHSTTCTAYGTGGTNKVSQLFSLWRTAVALIKKDSYDVISSQDTYFLGLAAWLLAKRYHLGLEVQVLGIEKMNFLRRLLTKFVLKKAGSIRVLSLGLKKRLMHEFNIPDIRMLLVPIYVDVSSLGFSSANLTQTFQDRLDQNIRSFKEAYEGRFNIISVNRLVPIKNIQMQLEAMSMLKEKFPQILLHIIGDGPLQAELQKSISEKSLDDTVILHGFKSGADLSPFFTQSDCFVLTSNFEGYGMVVIEAATASLPIVMTDVGCAGEVIIDQESGLIVPPADTVSFTNALERMITDKVFRVAVGRGAQSSIALLPSFDTVLGKYKASWEQALTNKL